MFRFKNNYLSVNKDEEKISLKTSNIKLVINQIIREKATPISFMNTALTNDNFFGEFLR